MAQPTSGPQGENSLPFRESGDSESSSAGQAPASAPGDGAGPERELLEQIVRRTLTEQEGGGLPPGLLGELQDIARRERGRSQTWEATVPQLIDLVLTSFFSSKLLEPQVRGEMAQEIADTLLHDENAAARLRRFWERICEGAS